MDGTPDDVVAVDVNGLLVKSLFYVLHLYITGATPNSTRAVRNVKEICETYLKGHYELIIIDIYQQPMLAEADQIIAAPTLVKKQPLPIRRLIGDMSDRDRVLSGLGIVS